MSEFIGHLHPALVHLPIGILLIALLLIWLSRKKAYKISQPVIKVVLLAGVISALFSCITGYVLSTQDDYEKPLVIWHMWMGISVAIASMLLYMKVAKSELDILYKSLAVLLLLLILITGHLGGSLTHGTEYLSFAGKEDTIPEKPIADIQVAKVYADVIRPVFQTKCYSCHSSRKQKGGLRLDKYDLIMKGGKEGKIILASNPGESDIIKRLLLPNENEDHMPPRDKPQLTAKQIMLLHWWIENGNDTARKVKELPQPDSVKLALLSLQADHQEHKLPSNIPSAPVDKADGKAVQLLKNKGIVVLPVAQNSNYLMVNFVTAVNITDKDIELLLPLKQQLVWLKCGNTRISDSAVTYVAQCSNLTFLQLDNTQITDAGLLKLASLHQLQSLNLTSTNITAKGMMALRNLKSLRSVYLYKTKVDKQNWPALQKQFPKTVLDSGNYNVPLFTNDTVVLKARAY